MADLNTLKQKYGPVISTIEQFAPEGAKLEDVSLDGEQLHLKASVPSTVIANRVWDAIKKVDASFSDLKHEIVTTGGETQAYTVKSGDTLSAISKKFYGSANEYPKVAQANNIPNPDQIKVGQQLTLPVI